jgi:hypothetical protein
VSHCRSDRRGRTYVELPTDRIQHRGALAIPSIRILIRNGNEGVCIPPDGEYIGPPRRPGRELGERKGVPPLADQASVVVWEKICEAYYASITDVSGTIRFFLIVEEIRGGCHWFGDGGPAKVSTMRATGQPAPPRRPCNWQSGRRSKTDWPLDDHAGQEH